MRLMMRAQPDLLKNDLRDHIDQATSAVGNDSPERADDSGIPGTQYSTRWLRSTLLEARQVSPDSSASRDTARVPANREGFGFLRAAMGGLGRGRLSDSGIGA